MMAYRGAVHESTGVTPNLLVLGRELEVPLDAMPEAPPDAPPLKTDYTQADQKRLADYHNPEDGSSETVELTLQVVPQTDSSVRGRPSRQRNPPSRYGTWLAA